MILITNLLEEYGRYNIKFKIFSLEFQLSMSKTLTNELDNIITGVFVEKIIFRMQGKNNEFIRAPLLSQT